jgi:hypothetical protein
VRRRLVLVTLLFGLVVALLAQLRAPPAATVVAPERSVRARGEQVEPRAVWRYETLTPEERAVVDRGRDARGWDEVHRGFSAAGREDQLGSSYGTGSRLEPPTPRE